MMTFRGIHMSQSERLAKIQSLLRNKGFVRLEELKSRLQVSRATIMRDFELLRDRLGAPILYDKETNSYRLMNYSDPSVYWEYEFPGMWLNPEEGYAVLTLYNVMRKLDPGFLRNLVHPLVRPIKRMLGAKNFPVQGLDKKIDIDLRGFLSDLKINLQPVFAALSHDEEVTLSWRNPDGQEQCAIGHINKLRLTNHGWEIGFTAKDDPAFTITLNDILACKTDTTK